LTETTATVSTPFFLSFSSDSTKPGTWGPEHLVDYKMNGTYHGSESTRNSNQNHCFSWKYYNWDIAHFRVLESVVMFVGSGQAPFPSIFAVLNVNCGNLSPTSIIYQVAQQWLRHTILNIAPG
jgi:hypothetical protein